MKPTPESVFDLNGQSFEVIKPARLREGMVLKTGDVFARVGPKESVLEEQIHTVSLYNRGFPVPQVLASGELDEDWWYFTEASLGQDTFHKVFTAEYRQLGHVTDTSYTSYLRVVEAYAKAQSNPENKTSIAPNEFIKSLIPHERVLPQYCYFGYEESVYLQALQLASTKLQDAPMGIIQHDLNPYNVLEKCVIDFELVGFGPAGFDTLMSARWAGGWYTDYPSRMPVGYKLNSAQIAQNDAIVDAAATNNGLTAPTQFLQEFLLLKSAWAVSNFDQPSPDWPPDRIAFRNYRANVLNLVVGQYLAGTLIAYKTLSSVPGGEIIH